MSMNSPHLCQPDCGKSCGACCGLYNWNDHSRDTLEPLLHKKTEFFQSLVQSSESFDTYREKVSELFPQSKLFETIYNCEFLGFVDEKRERIGCLLHPMVNNGEDLRGNSFYGKELCASHQCPSYTYLTESEKKAVIYGSDDWYLYGLVITDIDFVKEYFRIINNTLGETINPERIKRPDLKGIISDYFRLKEEWEFRSKKKRFGKYCFSYAEYHIAKIEYQKKLGIKGSSFDKILVSLGSEFNSADELHRAEVIIQASIDRFIDAYRLFPLDR
ncbi:MAG: cytoplasmic protein [bacterium]|nr:MAG: cytoplasmic protein [bacterium]